jgi:hypothetical protein
MIRYQKCPGGDPHPSPKAMDDGSSAGFCSEDIIYEANSIWKAVDDKSLHLIELLMHQHKKRDFPVNVKPNLARLCILLTKITAGR